MRGVTRKMPPRLGWARFAGRAAALSAVLLTVAVQQATAQTYVDGISTPALPSGGISGSFGTFGPYGGRLVGCSSGTCVAVGDYEDASSNTFPLLTPFTDGTPGASAAVSLPADADAQNGAGFQGVSCWAAGACVGVGSYLDAATDPQAMIVPISAGKPGAVSTPAFPNDVSTTDPQSPLNDVGCWSAGSCIAVGQYYTTSGSLEALAVPITGGTAGAAFNVTLPVNADPSDQNAELFDISCWSAGSCVAVGSYYDSSGNGQAMVVPITGGVPQPASEVTSPADAAGNPTAGLYSASCTSGGSCFAVGNYDDTSSDYEAMTVAITNGAPGVAVEVAQPANAAAIGSQEQALQSVSCAPSGPCEAVGYYLDSSGASQAMATQLGGGGVDTGTEIPAPANPTGGIAQYAGLSGVSCLAGPACVAVGFYQDTNDNEQGMIVPISGTAVGTAAQEAPDSEVASSSELNAVSCDTSGSCAAGGEYSNASGNNAPYEVNVEAALSVGSASLPSGTVSSAYQQTLTATGAWGSYSWSLSSGSLPAGLSLNSQTGVISGTPTTAGSSDFTVQASGAGLPAQTATQALSITVTPATQTAAPHPPHVTVSGGRLQVKSNRLKVKLSCSGSTCKGTLKLDATEVVTVKHGKKRVNKRRTVVIGSARFSVAAGKSGTSTVTLTKTGRKLLSKAKGHKLAVKLVAAASGGNSASHSATIWMNVAKKKHKR
jgi:mRNA-degrading endonuclease toxin of MazEF toxin-antitoxin module